MITKTAKPGCTACRGFTLAEALMAVVILGIAAAGVLLPFSSGAMVQAEGVRMTIAAKMASDLMEEIVQTPFEDIVSSYNYAEPQGQMKDAGGTVFSEPTYANYSREVSCQKVYVLQEKSEPTEAEAVLIHAEVRVYYSGKPVAVINRLIGK